MGGMKDNVCKEKRGGSAVVEQSERESKLHPHTPPAAAHLRFAPCAAAALRAPALAPAPAAAAFRLLAIAAPFSSAVWPAAGAARREAMASPAPLLAGASAEARLQVWPATLFRLLC